MRIRFDIETDQERMCIRFLPAYVSDRDVLYFSDSFRIELVLIPIDLQINLSVDETHHINISSSSSSSDLFG